jgi:hypothetical protein
MEKDNRNGFSSSGDEAGSLKNILSRMRSLCAFLHATQNNPTLHLTQRIYGEGMQNTTVVGCTQLYWAT